MKEDLKNVSLAGLEDMLTKTERQLQNLYAKAWLNPDANDDLIKKDVTKLLSLKCDIQDALQERYLLAN